MKKIRLLYIFSKDRDFKNPDKYPSTFFYGWKEFKKDPKFETSEILLTTKGFLFYLWKPFETIHFHLTSVGFALDRVVRQRKYINTFDVVLAVNDSSGLPLLLLKKLGFIRPKIFMISAGLVNNLVRMSGILSPFKWTYASLLKKAHRIFLWSPLEKDLYGRIVGENAFLLPLQIDTKFFSANNTPKEDFFLSVGRDPERDPETLFRAFGDNGEKLVAIGNTPYIRKNIWSITKRLSFQEMKELYQKAYAVIIPIKKVARISGQTALVEALAMGKAIIVARNEAILSQYQLRENEDVLFYEPENVDDLAKQITRLKKDPSLIKRLEENAKKFIESLPESHRPATYETIARETLNSLSC